MLTYKWRNWWRVPAAFLNIAFTILFCEVILFDKSKEKKMNTIILPLPPAK